MRPKLVGRHDFKTRDAWNSNSLIAPPICALREPFHAGAGWKAMDVGLEGMAGMLAD